MSQEFKFTLAKLQTLPLSKSIKKDLRSVASKWAFIEENVINNSGETAYLTVYYNKQKIAKLLKKSQKALSGA